MFLSIIIPIYNEENSIIDVLQKLHKLKLPSFVKEKEIIVVDDYSNDDSLKKIKSFVPDNIKLTIFTHETNKGKGAAVRTGLKHINGDVVLIQDADLELNPEDIPRMLLAMKNLKVEFINGSRFLPGVDRPLHSYRRYLGNRFFTFLTSLLINVKLTDMACGYKLIKKDLLYNFILRENRFGFESELIIKALRVKRNNVAEVPVGYFPRNEGEGKKLKNTDAFKILWVIIKYGLLKLN